MKWQNKTKHNKSVWLQYIPRNMHTGFAVLCCGYTLTDFPISIRLTSLALWQSNDCPSASKATLMNMYKYFMWIHYGRLHNHNKAKHNKTDILYVIKFQLLLECENGRHLADGIIKYIFLNETFWISNGVPLMCVSYGLVENRSSLVQIMACRISGAKPLSKPMRV